MNALQPACDTSFSASGYHGVRTLVLGASGFIGRWVARALTRSGAQLHLAVRNQQKARVIFERYHVHGTVHPVDLIHDSAVQDLFDSVRPTITFNLAGYGVDPSQRDESLAGRINEQLPGVLAGAALRNQDSNWSGRQLVHVGSALEYGEARGNLVETTTCKPNTLYGRTKLAGTRRLARRCRTDGLRGLTARLFTVYGPGEHAGRLLPSLLSAAGKNEALPLTEGLQKRDFTYVEDIAEGLLRLGLSHTELDVVNLATGCLTTVRRFCETAAAVLGIPEGRLRFGALPVRSEEMSHDPVCLDRLRELLDWVPSIDIEQGIRRTLEHTLT